MAAFEDDWNAWAARLLYKLAHKTYLIFKDCKHATDAEPN